MASNLNYRPVIVFAPSVLAGAEKVVIKGTEALFALGLDPHLIVIQETRLPKLAQNFINEFSPAIKITILESKKALDFELISKIKTLLKAEDKQIILHTHGFKALVTCKLISLPFLQVHTHHGNTSHTFKVKIYEWLADQAMKRCDHVFAVSKAMQQQLYKSLSPYKKISVVENMLSFKNSHEIRNYRVDKKIKSENQKINFIFIGRLSPEKGLLPFLKNISRLTIKDKISLTVLGDGPEMLSAKEYVVTPEFNCEINFLGFVSNPSDYLKDADILVLPSFTEGLPMTLIESLCSGIPVIANDVGAIKSLLHHNQNGFLTSNNDFSEWEKAIKSCLENLNRWQEFTMDHAQELTENYSAQNWGIKTKFIYEKLIS